MLSGQAAYAPQHLRMIAKLGPIAAPELPPSHGVVTEPVSKRRARGKFIAPFIDRGLALADTPWPEAIHKNAASIPHRWSLVGALQFDVCGADHAWPVR